jgi:hypothetical protein
MLNALVEEVHTDAIAKGWWQTYENGKAMPRPSLEIRMLIVSELSEATEEVRHARLPIYQWSDHTHTTAYTPSAPEWNPAKKPEGEAVELADVVIRICDYFGSRNWNLERHLQDEHIELPKLSNALEYHMHFVKMVSQAEGSDEEKTLGRVVSLVKDYFTLKSWDFEKTLRLKVDYNKSRAHRHGNKLH